MRVRGRNSSDVNARRRSSSSAVVVEEEEEEEEEEGGMSGEVKKRSVRRREGRRKMESVLTKKSKTKRRTDARQEKSEVKRKGVRRRRRARERRRLRQRLKEVQRKNDIIVSPRPTLATAGFRRVFGSAETELLTSDVRSPTGMDYVELMKKTAWMTKDENSGHSRSGDIDEQEEEDANEQRSESESDPAKWWHWMKWGGRVLGNCCCVVPFLCCVGSCQILCCVRRERRQEESRSWLLAREGDAQSPAHPLPPAPVGRSDVVAGARTRHVEQSATGLLQDLCLAVIQFNDSMGAVFRKAIRLRLRGAFGLWWNSVKTFCSTAVSMKTIDVRPIGTVILDEGYPYELCHAETLDGYDLWMHRIPNRRSERVILFQHGITDSAFCWIGNRFRSPAFRCFDEGCDVFMGDFRGSGHSEIIRGTGNVGEMWDYTIDEYAKFDMRAFVERIVAIKREEFQDPKANVRIDLVAHSMGGGIALAYLVWSDVLDFDHHIKKTVVLAPCGVHRDSGFMTALRVSRLQYLFRFLRIPYLGIRSRFLRKLVAKLSVDLFGQRGIRTLISVFLSAFVIGGSSRRFPFNSLPSVVFHLFQGFPTKLCLHFAQLSTKKSFYGYDYGSVEENLKHHGSEIPVHYLDYYGRIDIPVILFAGSADRVIPPSDVKRHFDALMMRPDRPEHQFRELPLMGHLDLSYSLPEQIIIAIEGVLQLGEVADESVTPFVAVSEVETPAIGFGFGRNPFLEPGLGGRSEALKKEKSRSAICDQGEVVVD